MTKKDLTDFSFPVLESPPTFELGWATCEEFIIVITDLHQSFNFEIPHWF